MVIYICVCVCVCVYVYIYILQNGGMKKCQQNKYS